MTEAINSTQFEWKYYLIPAINKMSVSKSIFAILRKYNPIYNVDEFLPVKKEFYTSVWNSLTPNNKKYFIRSKNIPLSEEEYYQFIQILIPTLDEKSNLEERNKILQEIILKIKKSENKQIKVYCKINSIQYEAIQRILDDYKQYGIIGSDSWNGDYICYTLKYYG